MNEKYLKEADVGLVVNTAGGLETHFPKFRPNELYERLGITPIYIMATCLMSYLQTVETESNQDHQ